MPPKHLLYKTGETAETRGIRGVRFSSGKGTLFEQKMKLDKELIDRLRAAVAAAGGAGEFSRRSRVDAANISRYLSGKVRSVGDDNWAKLEPFLRIPAHASAPPREETVANTPALRECIKDAMMRRGLRSADDLRRLIGYDSVRSVERLLAGKLNFFPEMLSAIFDALEIDPDDAPIAPGERELLAPRGIYRDGGMLVRPIPVVDWANAAGHLSTLGSCDKTVYAAWDPECTETVPAPVGTRRDIQAFRVSGVSMEPTINDGDILFVEPVSSPDDIPQHKIVVAKLAASADSPESVICKRLSRHGGRLELTSDNPAGRSWSVSPEQLVWIGLVLRKISEL